MWLHRCRNDSSQILNVTFEVSVDTGPLTLWMIDIESNGEGYLGRCGDRIYGDSGFQEFVGGATDIREATGWECDPEADEVWNTKTRSRLLLLSTATRRFWFR